MIFGHSIVGATIMDVVYGIQVTSMDDPYITIAEKVLLLFTSAMLPGTFLVDMLPFRKPYSLYFPALFQTHFEQ